ncbi:FG-GAP repeat protein [Streptomyces albidoflavus]|uniref:FG-GAP repeat protein n=1 Tax=Streptomyces albidoflavus TaxID=1886 RepID=UPI0033E0762D
MQKRLTTLLAAATTAALTGGLLAATAPTAVAAPVPLGEHDADFNGDGYADLALTSSRSTVGGKANAGQVAIVYGGATKNRYATIHQDSPGVPGGVEAGDYFGADLGTGDFDNDGYDDLVTGAPGEDVGSDKDGGTAVILWGSPSGLKGGTTLKDPRPTKHDGFGSPVDAGDFNGDGKDDIALATAYGYASVDLYRGPFTRSGATGPATVHTPPIYGDGDGVQNLHSGDVDGDGKDDLIVNGYATSDNMNANYWLPGTSTGVSTARAQRLTAGIITDVGDVDHDGFADVVVGTSWDEGIAGAAKGGAVHLVHGTPDGPAYGDIQTVTQSTKGVPGASEKGDWFGAELDLGDINGDGRLDLVVGLPGEDIDGVKDAGSALVLYGAADGSGITTTGSRTLHQNSPGVPNENEKEDLFGNEVHIDDLNGDGRGDVIIGASGENSGNGAVYALTSAASGSLTSTGGLYASTFGISTAGTPHLGINFAD